ncbi:MAG: tetratricopeptide repeat-containing S1 family peptidase, partial [candidate division WOR-3 bacterium]
MSYMTLLSFLLAASAGQNPALVEVNCYGKYSGEGVGFFIDTNGTVATALHAIVGDEPEDYPDSVVVITSSGKRYKVNSVLAYDVQADVCLIKIDISNKSYIPLLVDTIPGDSVVIPGLLKPEVRTLFSRIYRDELGYQRAYINSPCESGHSGSPVLNASDKAIGLMVEHHEFTPSSYISQMLSNKGAHGIREIHGLYAQTPRGFVSFGLSASERGDTSKAISYYRKATTMKPALAVAHNNLGVLLKDQGRLSEAEKEYREAIRINPDYAEAHYNLGNLLYVQG